MAIADSRYRFIHADIGSHGVNNDSYVFNSGEFCNAINDGTIVLELLRYLTEVRPIPEQLLPN